MVVDHPSILKVIDVLRKIEKARNSDQLKMNAGYLPPQKKNRKYREADDQIKRLVIRFIGSQPQSTIDLLRDVSHNFEMDPEYYERLLQFTFSVFLVIMFRVFIIKFAAVLLQDPFL